MNREIALTLSAIALLLTACSKKPEHDPLVGTWSAKYMRYANMELERVYSFFPDGTWQNVNYVRVLNEEEQVIYFSGLWSAGNGEIQFNTLISTLRFDPDSDRRHSYEYHFPIDKRLKMGKILFTLSHVDPIDLSKENNANNNRSCRAEARSSD
jgi:hypothetical protein